MIDRRNLLAAAATTAALSASIAAEAATGASPKTGAGGHSAKTPFKPLRGAKLRMVYVNDLCGDIDGLFATVHALLTPSIDLRAIVGTATSDKDETAQKSVALAKEILALMGSARPVPIFEGAAGKLNSVSEPVRTPGVQAIIDEAMREDSLPLVVAVGGGLTEIASALILEPRITSRLTLAWIGGIGSDRANAFEYNFAIDPVAAQYIFNDSTVPLWQIPSDIYATCVVSASEIQAYVAPYGAIGNWLYQKLFEAAERMMKYKLNTGETWTLGDSPLVLITALGSWVPGQMGSNIFEEIPAPRVDARGRLQPRDDGRKIRIYRSIDTRLMMSDFFAKMRVKFG